MKKLSPQGTDHLGGHVDK